MTKEKDIIRRLEKIEKVLTARYPYEMCDHDYQEVGGTFPYSVCKKCGAIKDFKWMSNPKTIRFF